MPSEKELRALVRETIVDVFKTEKIVPNRPTEADPKAPVTYFTVAQVLANLETDDDNRSARIEKKLDELLGLLRPKA